MDSRRQYGFDDRESVRKMYEAAQKTEGVYLHSPERPAPKPARMLTAEEVEEMTKYSSALAGADSGNTTGLAANDAEGLEPMTKGVNHIKRWWHRCSKFDPELKRIVVIGRRSYRYCYSCCRLHENTPTRVR